MGGKSLVTCQCCHLPLIPSSKIEHEISQCNLKSYIQESNPQVQTNFQYTRKEPIVCSNVNCNSKVCYTWYKSLTEDTKTMIIPQVDNTNDIEADMTLSINSTWTQ